MYVSNGTGNTNTSPVGCISGGAYVCFALATALSLIWSSLRRRSFRSIVLLLAGGSSALAFLTAGGLAAWAVSGGADADGQAK